MHTSRLLVAVVPFALFAACSDSNNDVTGTNSTATVRFVNATGNSNVSVANAGVVGTGNENLGFGAGSTCMTVNTSTAAGAGLTFTNAGSGSSISGFTPSFTNGGNYTVIAYTDASGNTQFTTLNNTFTPTAGSAGLRIVNLASGSGTLTAMGNGTALGTGTGVAFGSAGDFFSVPSGSQDITFRDASNNTVLDAGSMNFTAGQNSTLVVGPAATGSTMLRSFSISAC